VLSKIEKKRELARKRNLESALAALQGQTVAAEGLRHNFVTADPKSLALVHERLAMAGAIPEAGRSLLSHHVKGDALLELRSGQNRKANADRKAPAASGGGKPSKRKYRRHRK